MRIAHVAAHAEALHQPVLADVVLADHELAALLDRENFFDAADGLAVLVDDFAADQQLDVYLENGILPTTCSRSQSSHASSGCSSTPISTLMSISFTFDQGMR